jgi:hypothetical protein
LVDILDLEIRLSNRLTFLYYLSYRNSQDNVLKINNRRFIYEYHETHKYNLWRFLFCVRISDICNIHCALMGYRHWAPFRTQQKLNDLNPLRAKIVKKFLVEMFPNVIFAIWYWIGVNIDLLQAQIQCQKANSITDNTVHRRLIFQIWQSPLKDPENC